MADKTIPLDPTGGPVSIEVTIGKAQHGKYELWLYDQQGNKGPEVGAGLNDDTSPRSAQLAQAPAALVGQSLLWNVAITAFTSDPNQPYVVVVRVQQPGRQAVMFTNTGSFQTYTAFYDYAAFV